MYQIIIIILFLFLINYISHIQKNKSDKTMKETCVATKESYINYQELSYQGSEVTCPQIHADNYQELTNNRQMIQPFGYTKNDLFHMTRFMKTDIPLPTDPDFFKHI